MLRPSALLAASLLLLVPVADTAHADTRVNCAKAETTYEMNICADRGFQAADAKLNAAYKSALAFVRGSGGERPYDAASWEKALRTSQIAWIAFRDADCSVLVPMSWGGGTGTTAAVLGCMTTKTEARTRELIELTQER